MANHPGHVEHMQKPTSAEEYKLIGNFHAVRKTLRQDRFADRLDRPLAYWALPNDRRLPLAFLGRTLRDLLETPFEELAATPGIGQKKISTMIKLLHRAKKEQPRGAGDGAFDGAGEKKAHGGDRAARDGFDPAAVSEAVWEQWRDTVVRHGVDCEKLGRIAPTLQTLPTVIWHTTLETYCEYSITEIRQLKTHGEKRVRMILEVFCSVHSMLGDATPQSHLSVRLLPKFSVPIECWLDEVIEGRDDPVTRDDVRKSLVMPLLEQIEIDTGPTVSRLAEGRLGINHDTQTVRQQSRRMGVTRARVYQLLEDCAKVMAVRWPEGNGRLRSFAAHLENSGGDADAHALVCATIELFFPDEDELANRAERDGEAE
jgi:hypothetical protein